MAGAHDGARQINAHDHTWLEAHEALSRLAQERASADAEEGRWLLAARRSAAHVHLGYGSFGEYIERLFGYQRRTTQEKLRVAEALEDLPLTECALADGRISWSAVRELARVAMPETEGEWLQAASGRTVHQLEELVSGKAPGDTPSSFGERSALGGSSDDGRSSYQIALSICPECSRGAQQADGDLVAVGPDVVAMARCDAQDLGLLDRFAASDRADTNDTAGRVSAHVGAGSRAIQTIPPRVRRARGAPPE